MRPLPFSILYYFLAFHFNVFPTQAVNFPIHGRTSLDSPASRLTKRADISGTSPTSANVTTPIANSHNAQYFANITLGGTTVTVLLDTGSSDLWVNFPGAVPTTTDLGKALTLSYAVGRATGNVHTIDLQFDDYTVKDQAFLLVTDTSTFSGDIHAQGYSGLVGLGPNAGSVILDKIDNPSADTMLARIFQQDHATSNFISFLLDRSGDPTPTFTGQITISEYAKGLENITSMPKLEIDMLHKIIEEDQHWQLLTDKDNGIIGPDGQAIKIKSIVPSAPKGQLVAVIDSGFTFSQVPRDVSDAIYGRVRNAVYDEKSEYWTVPCGQMLNISFNFGGQNYPVHPLDTVNDDFGIQNAAGNRVCIGSFQPITSAFSLLGNYDMILGMSFLRNTYTLLDFGNWVDDSDDRGDPFVQLLSVTKVADAVSDFNTVRLSGSASASTDWSLLPASEQQHSPISEEEKKKRYQEMILSRWPYIFVGCLAFVILCVGFCVWRCCRRRRAKGGAAASQGMFGFGKPKNDENQSYLPLQAHGSVQNFHKYDPPR